MLSLRGAPPFNVVAARRPPFNVVTAPTAGQKKSCKFNAAGMRFNIEGVASRSEGRDFHDFCEIFNPRSADKIWGRSLRTKFPPVRFMKHLTQKNIFILFFSYLLWFSTYWKTARLAKMYAPLKRTCHCRVLSVAAPGI